jgi:hypothetical protein
MAIKPTSRKKTTRTKKFKGSVPKSTSSSRRAPKRKNIRVVPLKAQVVEQLPETPLTQKGLTLKQLLRNTPRFRRETGEYEVTLSKVKKAKTTGAGLPALTAIAVHKDPFMPNKTIKKRPVYLIGLDSHDKPISKQRRVMVSCNCEDFVFYGGEYACALHGAAKIIYGNGEPPRITNPSNVPFLCKHLSALAYHAIKKGL